MRGRRRVPSSASSRIASRSISASESAVDSARSANNTVATRRSSPTRQGYCARKLRSTRKAALACEAVNFTIDADIRIARTLPARVYADPALFVEERERIFARTWHYASYDDSVKVTGQVHPFTLLPGMLDEPLLLT